MSVTSADKHDPSQAAQKHFQNNMNNKEITSEMSGTSLLKRHVSSSSIPAGHCIAFSQQPHSHEFQDRIVPLPLSGDEVKVGRMVARWKPSADNTIFDCKVLSRNHAVLWSKEGKVWIRDTQSSNGTWVNGQRLSRTAEESAPRELFSGDIVQFGVEVLEMQTNHACIISQVTIFMDGKEVPRESSAVATECSLQTQEQIYQLSHYLQEALFREQAMERKMEKMQTFLTDIENSTEQMWQVLMNEDRLMSKLRNLELQLDVFSSEHSSESLEALAAEAVREKELITAQREAICEALLQEKLQVLERLGEVESHLENSVEECGHLKKKCEEVENNFSSLCQTVTRKLEEADVRHKKLDGLEEAHRHLNQNLRSENRSLQKKVQEMESQLDSLQEHLLKLETEKSETEAQYGSLKTRFEYAPEPSFSCVDEDMNHLDEPSLDELKNGCLSSEPASKGNCAEEEFPLSECLLRHSFSMGDSLVGVEYSQYVTMNSTQHEKEPLVMERSTDSAVVVSPLWEEEVTLLLHALRAQIPYWEALASDPAERIHDMSSLEAVDKELEAVPFRTHLSEVETVVRQHTRFMLSTLRSLVREQQAQHASQQVWLHRQLEEHTDRERQHQDAIRVLQAKLDLAQEIIKTQDEEKRRMTRKSTVSNDTTEIGVQQDEEPTLIMSEDDSVHSSRSTSILSTLPLVNIPSLFIDNSSSHYQQQQHGDDELHLTPQARWLLAALTVPIMVLIFAVLISMEMWLMGRS